MPGLHPFPDDRALLDTFLLNHARHASSGPEPFPTVGFPTTTGRPFRHMCPEGVLAAPIRPLHGTWR